MRNGESTPPYERLSRNDELQGESNSISNQKMMLCPDDKAAAEDYCGGGLARALLVKGMNTDVIPHGKDRGLMVFHLDHSSNLWIIMRA